MWEVTCQNVPPWFSEPLGLSRQSPPSEVSGQSAGRAKVRFQPDHMGCHRVTLGRTRGSVSAEKESLAQYIRVSLPACETASLSTLHQKKLQGLIRGFASNLPGVPTSPPAGGAAPFPGCLALSEVIRLLCAHFKFG